MLELNRVYNEDCIGEHGMCLIPDGFIDLILCDLPYGTTRCKWDSIIPLDKLWKEYLRIIKPNGAIVLTCDEPFTSVLISSNLKHFRTKWIWDKVKANGFLNAKRQPMKRYEEVVVFSKQACTYNPQMTKGEMRRKQAYNRNAGTGEMVYGKFDNIATFNNDKYPTNIIVFSNANQRHKLHPTEKPVPLFEYLIRTYSNPSAVILDNCIGSGTTAVATMQVGGNRQFIGYEISNDYCEITRQRIRQVLECKNSEVSK